MRLALKAADDPRIDAIERRERGVIQVNSVCRISKRADAQAERPGKPVVLVDQSHVHPGHLDGLARLGRARHQHRPVEARGLPRPKRVAEPAL